MLGDVRGGSAGKAVLCALVVAAAVAGCSAEEPAKSPAAATPPPGVTFEEGGPAEMRAIAAQAITKLREKDAAGLAALDLGPEQSEGGGAQAQAGAAWLVRYFADPLSGDVTVTFQEEPLAGDLAWFACLGYGDPKRELELGFIGYRAQGEGSDRDGGESYSFPASSYPTEGEPAYEKAESGQFCGTGMLRSS
ncbi:hypothetical protein EDD29_2341 [Actinocorallia herbida]|uniref:Uncharacterized protein n=1 Tax=Actinocorallia herbida TaxID=58109 RepID=A0A3N1CU22_9ACTN|nr:hypothetical protein [Actinocorallia herbida]ROO84812.1 hypothetical protein EDD29_2341 [Actinocorallia herbida]